MNEKVEFNSDLVTPRSRFFQLFLLDFVPWMIHGTSTATRVAIIVLDGTVLI